LVLKERVPRHNRFKRAVVGGNAASALCEKHSGAAEESRKVIRTARSSRKDAMKRTDLFGQFGWYRGSLAFRPKLGAKGFLFALMKKYQNFGRKLCSEHILATI
jgi:hypothetical protein